MTKSEFIDRLCQGLRFESSADEIEQVVTYYDQAIDDRVEDGMTEEEAVAAMGDVESIIRQTLDAWAQERRERGGSPGQEDAGNCHRAFDAGAIERVEIFDTAGNIRILPSQDGMIHLDYTVTEDWRYDISVGPVLTVRRVRNQGPEEKLTFDLFGYRLSIPKPNFGGLFSTELSVTLRVPSGVSLTVDVNLASGDTECSGVELGALFVRSTSGDIVVRGVRCQGRLSLISASGDVDAVNITAAQLHCSTVSGDVDTGGIYGGDLELVSVSGDIGLTGGCTLERLVLKSVSGDIDAQQEAVCRSVSAETVSGDIELVLPCPETLYDLAVRSIGGDVSVPSGCVGGPVPVRLKSMSGDVTVRTEA